MLALDLKRVLPPFSIDKALSAFTAEALPISPAAMSRDRMNIFIQVTDKRSYTPTRQPKNVPQQVAIPSFFRKPSHPTIPLEPLRREQSLRNIEKSGWRDSNRPLLIGTTKNPSPRCRKRMGSWCQSERSLSNLPTIRNDQSQCSESEEGVCGGFGNCIG